jgi:hypothetical protein
MWSTTGSKISARKLAKDAAKGWYNELYSPGYNYNRPGFTSGTGHFTAMVWKSTRELGCGAATRRAGRWNKVYVVCHYCNSTPNITNRGYFRANVMPLKRRRMMEAIPESDQTDLETDAELDDQIIDQMHDQMLI